MKRYRHIKLLIVSIAASILSILLIFSIIIMGTKADDSEISQELNTDNANRKSNQFNTGDSIYNNDCKSCHLTKNMKHYNFDDRLDELGEKYFISYLSNQDSLLINKDPYALTLKEEYNNIDYTHKFKYSDVELKELLKYIRDK